MSTTDFCPSPCSATLGFLSANGEGNILLRDDISEEGIPVISHTGSIGTEARCQSRIVL
jgi:hypothetical protein